VLLGLLLIILACTRLILRHDFLQSERTHTLNNAVRTHAFIHNEMHVLDQLAQEWTQRPDLYDMLRDERTVRAIPENLHDTTIRSLDLHLCVIRDAAGRVVFDRDIDQGHRQDGPVLAEMMTALERYRSLAAGIAGRQVKAVTGIVLTPRGPMLVAVRPMIGDTPQAPSRGSLLIGRYLDTEALDRCATVTNLPQALFLFSATNVSPDVHRAQSLLSRTSVESAIHPLNAQTIAGYAAFRDLNGAPAFLLRFTLYRDIYQNGLQSMHYLLLVILLVGLCFSLAIIWLVDRLVFRPLLALQTGVRRIGQDGELAARLTVRTPVRIHDEFDHLTDAVNRMLDALETEHRQTLTALHDRQARVKTILDSISTGVLILDPDTCQIIEANQSACRLIGSTPSEIVGVPCTRYLQGIDCAQARADGGSEQVLHRAIGGNLSVLIRVAPIMLDERRHLVASLVDISALKQVERKLVEREHHLTALVQAHQHLLLASPEDDIATGLAEVLGLLGHASHACRTFLYTVDPGPKGEANMRPMASWSITGVSAEPSVAFTLLPRWREALSRGEQIAGDTVTFSGDEQMALVLRGVVSFCLLPLQRGERLVGFVGFEQCGAESGWDDATYDLLRAAVGALYLLWEQRQAQHALWQSENRYRLLFNSGNDMIFVNILASSEDQYQTGAYIEVNDIACRQLGYAREKLLQLPPSEIEGSPHEGDTALPALTPTSRHRVYETDYRTRAGRLIPAEASQHVFELDGQPALLTIARDLTERKSADEQIKHVIADLSRSNEELQLFAYIASHDLQEPLRMVASYMELLARRYQAQFDERAHKYITYAVDGATRMQEMINALLQYSRVGTQGKALEPVALEKVLATTLQNLQISIQEAHAVITYGTLPVVAADEGQLTQLFQNLITNALKFHGEAVPRVHIAAERQGAEWQLAVRDNGIGIDTRYAERIFVLFQRLHSRTEYPGTGMGLAICKKIVERHGGRIWVNARPGQGSTFYFTLPAERGEGA